MGRGGLGRVGLASLVSQLQFRGRGFLLLEVGGGSDGKEDGRHDPAVSFPLSLALCELYMVLLVGHWEAGERTLLR